MITGATLNVYVFLLAFASAFLLGGRQPFFARSTRTVLVVLLALALAYAVSGGAWYRGCVGVATLVANALFVAFAALDYHGWRTRRLAGQD